jgi:hypothetical protein
MINMEYVELNEIEKQVLSKFGIRIRTKHGVFINSNGYKTVKTSRNNIKPLSDKIICIQTLFAWLKEYQEKNLFEGSILESRTLYTNKKLETHHKDGNKLNNLPCNIIGFLDRHDHNKLNYLLSLK